MGCKTVGRFTYDNATVANVPANGVIPFTAGTTSNHCVEYDGTNIMLKQGGLYLILFNCTQIATAAGTLETQLYRNGAAIPGAHAQDTVAAVGNTVNSAYSSLVTVPGNGSDTIINFRTVPATSIRIANAIIVKLA